METLTEPPTLSQVEITTSTGRRVRPFNLQVEDVDLAEIAHALSHTCRFNGHTREFYSVAEHSVRVSWELEDRGAATSVQAAGLLHDAGEAFIHDVVRPIKHFFVVAGEPFQYWEDCILATVFERFNLPLFPLPPGVVEVDRHLCDVEIKELLTGDRWRKPWSAESARRLFLQRAVQVGIS